MGATISTEKELVDLCWKDDSANIPEKIKCLKEKGHTCMITLESMPPQLGWCEKDVCSRSK